MKKINTILFDLDGTLLSIDMKEFEEIYYTSLSNAFKSIIAPDNFMAILYSSMKAMVKNKENRTNEEVFMSVMKERVGEELPAFQKHFIHYYENDFSVLRDAVNKNTDMLEALEILKKKDMSWSLLPIPYSQNLR